MRALIQRVKNANVKIQEKLIASIGNGMLIFLGIETADSSEDVEWLASKIVGLRIFDDTNGVMNLSVVDVKGDVLIVSQFTLHASTRKGNRPSYFQAALPEHAVPLYKEFITQIEKKSACNVKFGIFGENMQVGLTNDGPVTILIDSKRKE
ncbi:MAG: D-tyrosyl-tRNA(Tyr) deacylase [Bacteroidetes bacterium]|nr:D-tyrosyl-tRNA(Tyr) deacylase [Bacteroidota bacterium]MBU1719667.1 D-tyrosyl-tRNA(Tyr) deacylase [Bacteroidota bacterium]